MARKTLTRFLFLYVLFLFVTPARGEDPHAPQLDVSFLAQPAPIVQYGSTRLVYEMLVTNFSHDSYVLDAIEAKAGEMQFEFIGSPLAAMIMHLGVAAPKESPADRTSEAGRSLMIFFMLDLERNQAPVAIEHSLHVLDDTGGADDVKLAPLPVSDERPIVVAPPLRGEWIAGDFVNNGPDAAHRKAVIILDGHPWLAQRYAIDWVQVQTIDGVLTTWNGPESKNDSYFCYDQRSIASQLARPSTWPTACRRMCRIQPRLPIRSISIMLPVTTLWWRSHHVVMYFMRICDQALYT